MITITDCIKHHLSCSQDESGEYNSSYDIDFILSKPCSFSVYGKKLTIDRIKMTPENWGEELSFRFANAEEVFESFIIPNRFIKLILKRVRQEQKDGLLKGYIFDDVIYDLLLEARE
jgi:hypothetical protein